ncbi:metal-dependent transcriptional regulator [Robertkochia sediminum]|uniref:metal-dependent transcriptional regulator n=1 Tax=Robertkochia sediminum TaxID=2785326 RepID=UPI0019349624|nr:metal-dependent transcriptional regulator [Robertkochia sediminum]MBL7473106.1 metal-dependent transcriptional regulator [Robertkochia sediminum]
MTRSEENYIKTIFHLGGNKSVPVTTNAIAEQMETKPSSVTDMARKLGDKGLVHYKKYQGVFLSEKGIKTALGIIRKHRLWETFLVQKLDFSWDEVHEVAEQLEHIKSEKLIDELDAFLGFPKYDPHGDPIPTRDGEFHEQEKEKKLLSDLPVGIKGICAGVKDSSASFLQYLDKHGIAIGQSIHILGKEEFDNSLYLRIGEREHTVSHLIADNIYLIRE